MISKERFTTWLSTLRSNPRSVGVPHDELRAVQIEALSTLRPALNGQIGYSFIEAPTGTGKSGISTALNYWGPLTVLVHRRSLSDQYANEYGFAALHGKDAYKCAHKEKQTEWAKLDMSAEEYEEWEKLSEEDKLKWDGAPTAADCHYGNMSKCPYYAQCPYVQAKLRAYEAPRAVFTGRMALLNRTLRERPGVWVIDECHSIVEESLGYAQETLQRTYLQKMHLVMPVIPAGRVGLLEEDERSHLILWCKTSAGIVSVSQSQSKENARKKKLRTRLERLALELTRGSWFVSCDGETLTLQGLDAANVLERLWQHKRPTILMSATIGSRSGVGSLARMAGIAENDYTYESYPHPVPAKYRPIFDLGLPKMSHKNLSANPGLLQEQMEAITAWICSLPDHYRHLIVTTSNKRVEYCRGYLAYHLPERFYLPEGRSVNERTYNLTHCETPGIIAAETTSGFGTGVDWRLGDSTIVAGTQFFNRGDPYSMARLELMSEQGTTDYEAWLAYLGNTQAWGRNVRGLKDANGEYLYKPCASADGLATDWRALREYPTSIKEALVKL